MPEISVDSLVREVKRLKDEMVKADEAVATARERAKTVKKENEAKLRKLLPVVALYDHGQLPDASMRPSTNGKRGRAKSWPENPEWCLLTKHGDRPVAAKARGLCAFHGNQLRKGHLSAGDLKDYHRESKAFAKEYGFAVDENGEVIE